MAIAYEPKPATPARDLAIKIVANTIRIALCLGVMWLGVVVRRPYLVGDRIDAENGKLERQVMDVKQQMQRQRRELAILQTPQGMEREARRLGYVRPKEVPLMLPVKQ